MEKFKRIGFTLKDLKIHLGAAKRISERSFCLKKKVGAVLFNTHDGSPLSYGYGSPLTLCRECIRKKVTWTQDGCWSIHSEVRAIFNYFDSFKYTENLNHCAMLVTHGPCDQCLKYMSYFGIEIVIYDQDYKTDYSKWSHLIRVYKLKDLEDMFNDQPIESI